MRLPGTINVLDRKKRAKGRVPALAALTIWQGVSHPLTAFTPAQPIQTATDGPLPGGPTGVDISSGNVERLTTVDDLDDHSSNSVGDWCKALIVQGEDPDDPTKYASRSEALFAACCEMVRKGIPDQIIYSVITDPDFGISKSVRDKGRNAERYAKRQIKQAKENAIDPNLRNLNSRFAVIGNMGGKCRIIEEIDDRVLQRSRLTRQSFDDFRNRFMHQNIQIGTTPDGDPKYAPMGKWWLMQEARRQYDTIVFDPGGKEVEGAYNLWRGFGCEAIPGPKYELWLEHVKENICAGVDEHYEFVVNWLAQAVQQPARPGGVAIVMRGRRGTGKSIFANTFGALWGRHYLHVSNPQHLVGNFNAHLRDCVVLFGDEAFYAGDKKHESILKTLITEDLITIEAKGIDAEAAPNFVHLILASNNDWVIPAGADERRFMVVDVADTKMQNTAYFGQMLKAMGEGGLENLLHYLLNRDLSDWDSRKVPTTAALQEQKILSFSPEEEWWHRKLTDGILLRHHNEWLSKAPSDTLVEDYLRYTQKLGVNRRSSATALGAFLKKACPSGFPRRKRATIDVPVEGPNGEPRLITRREYVYEFPVLGACREHWDSKFSEKFAWDTEDEQKVF